MVVPAYRLFAFADVAAALELAGEQFDHRLARKDLEQLKRAADAVFNLDVPPNRLGHLDAIGATHDPLLCAAFACASIDPNSCNTPRARR